MDYSTYSMDGFTCRHNWSSSQESGNIGETEGYEYAHNTWFPSPEGMDFADESTFKRLKEVYLGTAFYGEFNKGDKEAYDYYKEKYAKFLNGEADVTDQYRQFLVNLSV